MEQVRQGDVMLVPVSEIPAGAKEVELEAGRVVLAHGEVTGHAHVVSNSVMLEHDGERYLRAGAAAAIRHEEHGTIPVVPGTYRVVRQREYHPEAVRNVAD